MVNQLNKCQIPQPLYSGAVNKAPKLAAPSPGSAAMGQGAPSTMPVLAPSLVPISRPTAVPIPDPTAVPISAPSNVPFFPSAPTEVIVPVPTAVSSIVDDSKSHSAAIMTVSIGIAAVILLFAGVVFAGKKRLAAPSDSNVAQIKTEGAGRAATVDQPPTIESHIERRSVLLTEERITVNGRLGKAI